MSEIIYKRPGYGTRGITWNSLKRDWIGRKSCIYSKFPIMYRFDEENGKYICRMSHIEYTFYFDTAKDLGKYIFSEFPKTFKTCELCNLGYFQIDEQKLKSEFNGYYTSPNKTKWTSMCNHYCKRCSSWNNDMSQEIINMPQEFNKMLPDDIKNLIDTHFLKQMNFRCKDCLHYIDYRTPKLRGNTRAAFISMVMPRKTMSQRVAVNKALCEAAALDTWTPPYAVHEGTCWFCYKQN